MNEFEPRMCRSPQDFEVAARDWMLHWGFSDASLTEKGPDNGIDIVASNAIAQVKSWMTPIGISEIQRLKGVAYDGRDAFFFSLMDYTHAARRFANDANVHLYRFTGYDGMVEPVNLCAKEFFHGATNSSPISTIASTIAAKYPQGMFEQVLDAFQKAISGYGFAIIKSQNCNRYVQFASWEAWGTDDGFLLETIGRTYATNSGSPLTYPELKKLSAIGWPMPENDKGNFACEASTSSNLVELVEVTLRTLIEVHGASQVEDLVIVVEEA